MKTDQPLFLNEEQVREHLRMTELIPAMEKSADRFLCRQSDSAVALDHIN